MSKGNRQGDEVIRVLVTGTAGFIGSTLTRELLVRGYEVVGVDSLAPYYDVGLKRANIQDVGPGDFTFVEGDLNKLDMTELFGSRGFELIFHLAGQPGVRLSWGSDFAEYTRANVDATQRLLEAARQNGNVRRFIYASSSSVYGQAEAFPTFEDALPRPFSPYGVTKLAGEHLAGLYQANYGLPTTAFRFFTVYGPRQRPDMAFTRFLRAADDGTEITIFGDGTQIRDFTYSEDIVSALILAGEFSGVLPVVMNLSGGSSVSVLEILTAIRRVSGKELNVVHRTKMLGDVFQTGGDSSLAKRSLGWLPAVDLEEGLKRQYEWVRST